MGLLIAVDRCMTPRTLLLMQTCMNVSVNVPGFNTCTTNIRGQCIIRIHYKYLGELRRLAALRSTKFRFLAPYCPIDYLTELAFKVFKAHWTRCASM